MTNAPLRLEAGMRIPFGGDRMTVVPQELATEWRIGDRLVVVQDDGALLHVPEAAHRLVDGAVRSARRAFHRLAEIDDGAITGFFDGFARRLEDDAVFASIAAANVADETAARTRGRSTTRLVLSRRMRQDMVAALRIWAAERGGRDEIVRTVEHTGWRIEERRAPLGVVGFVFEGRPNVFADATGVLRTGNSVVFRIGSDALGTARSIMEHAVAPALEEAGLPAGSVELLDDPARATGWALFSHPDLALAVARGSGRAVAQLGNVARQSGVPVSLHGTGGAWLIAGLAADPARLGRVTRWSLDRKVCNTLNVCAVPAARAAELVPVVLRSLEDAAAARSAPPRLHVVAGSEGWVPAEWFARVVDVARPEGTQSEPAADVIDRGRLAEEWEWEQSPEMTLVVVDTIAEATKLFNELSPRLVASIVSEDATERDDAWRRLDAPFVGDGFTRWVDGQFALDAPELGLSNWEGGRLLGRSGVLSGSSVHTLRLRAVQGDADLHR